MPVEQVALLDRGVLWDDDIRLIGLRLGLALAVQRLGAHVAGARQHSHRRMLVLVVLLVVLLLGQGLKGRVRAHSGTT